MAKSMVAAADATARRYATDPNRPYRIYSCSLVHKRKAAGRANWCKIAADQPDEAFDVATVIEQLVLCGTLDRGRPDPGIHEQVGDFGTLLHAGHDWMDKPLARRSM